LFLLPTGLGLFARLAPARLGATTVAAWYLAIFTGSLFAGLVGGLWSLLDRSSYFALLAGIAMIAALLLRLLDSPIRRIDPS
jgi:POT family proton-dependent oligopeptide transporter